MQGSRDDQLIEQAIKPTFAAKRSHVGMPPLVKKSSRSIAYFEFWPTFIVYLPIFFLWLYKALRFRGLTVPLSANPGFHLGGLVGESKAENFLQAGLYASQFIAPWCRIINNRSDIQATTKLAAKEMKEAGLSYPIIAKPDMGCRGEGVRIIRASAQLEEYFQDFPNRETVILQELIPWEPEAGIFYIRHPGESRGQIFSLTLKYQPYVYGNGVDTLRTLIEADPRAGKLTHLYLKRHKNYLDDVLEQGQPFRLAFAGSHSRGAIFKDGRRLITEELTTAFDQICKDIDGFYFGRFDVRFANEHSLKEGKELRIVEINGISSEAAHIWDADSSLTEVYRTLFSQYNTLFEIGAVNRSKGHKAGSVAQIIKGLVRELWVGRQYPDTE
ncbi:ATP-grasp domain-containing protein [Parendozoicomonas haliclonae]|uniref:ATP-grasp domain-containing protein n=1 Tax=Parendozoicomonas haliclonae TaxID=1960125 RepID=A0A1X7APT9_9GAMM|nr:ATP-grasp domain-containing protein [Parendozoicomonas haliclonae]SMA50265.1 hypothetical protein EHSB41UT_04059 [Parendozoicomonas haliclonae]